MIHLICALKCEAGPLAAKFQLEPDQKRGLYRSFSNRRSGITLCICGVGKLAASAGTMYAISRYQAERHDFFLNIGIAGHASLPLGSLVLADQVTDAGSGRKWIPRPQFTPALPQSGLVTMDQACDAYPEALVDMEAAGFYAAASRLAGPDRIYSLKVVSDNPQNPPCRIQPEKVCRLIESQLGAIGAFVELLQRQSVPQTRGNAS